MSKKEITLEELSKAYSNTNLISQYTNSFKYKGKIYRRGQKLNYHSNNGEIYPCKILYIDIEKERFKIIFYPSENTKYIDFDEIEYWFEE